LKPNILFILIDALRDDRCHGKNKTSKTPNLDYLIKNGTLFSNAFSCSDGTPVSLREFFCSFSIFFKSVSTPVTLNPAFAKRIESGNPT